MLKSKVFLAEPAVVLQAYPHVAVIHSQIAGGVTATQRWQEAARVSRTAKRLLYNSTPEAGHSLGGSAAELLALCLGKKKHEDERVPTQNCTKIASLVVVVAVVGSYGTGRDSSRSSSSSSSSSSSVVVVVVVVVVVEYQ